MDKAVHGYAVRLEEQFESDPKLQHWHTRNKTTAHLPLLLMLDRICLNFEIPTSDIKGLKKAPYPSRVEEFLRKCRCHQSKSLKYPPVILAAAFLQLCSGLGLSTSLNILLSFGSEQSIFGVYITVPQLSLSPKD